MEGARVQGLVPHLPPNQPRASARWWCADGFVTSDGVVTVESLEQRATPTAVTAPCGIAAPCSLPGPVMDHLACGQTRADQLRALTRWTPKRLFGAVREFARAQQRGKRHPRRHANESMSALDRRRLARFYAATPLLAATPTRPWQSTAAAYLFEVDAAAWLSSLALPPHQISSDDPKSIARRETIVAALEEGRVGLRVALPERAYPIGSLPALEAVVCIFAAAWMLQNTPEAPATDAEAWIPVP